MTKKRKCRARKTVSLLDEMSTFAAHTVMPVKNGTVSLPAVKRGGRVEQKYARATVRRQKERHERG